MLKRLSMFIIVCLVGVALTGCQTTDGLGPKQAVGTALGGALGGLAGSQVGNGNARLAATAGGALLGAWLGSEVGKSLDHADLLAQERATQTALETNPTGQPATWRNPDTGHRGVVTPVKTYERDGRPCRDFTQQVTIAGQSETVTGRACRDRDGWKLVTQGT